MAEKKETQESVSVAVPSGMSPDQFAQMMAAFAQQISQGIVTGINEHNPKKVTAGQYDPRTVFHPNKKARKMLRRPVLQNGTELNDDTLFDEEIDLFNKIIRSGRYINRLIEVLVRQDGSEEVLELRYKNKTIDDRMNLKGNITSLRDMLQKIVREQDEALAEEAEIKQQRRAFNTAATREARARAAAEAAAEQSLEP